MHAGSPAGIVFWAHISKSKVLSSMIVCVSDQSWPVRVEVTLNPRPVSASAMTGCMIPRPAARTGGA